MARPIRSLQTVEQTPLERAHRDVLAAEAELSRCVAVLLAEQRAAQERYTAQRSQEGYLSVEQIAAETSLSARHIYREIDRGALMALRVGRRRLVQRADLDAYLATLTTEVSA